jgi:sphingosine kinase
MVVVVSTHTLTHSLTHFLTHSFTHYRMSITDPLVPSNHHNHHSNMVDLTSTDGLLRATLHYTSKRVSECLLTLKDSLLIIETKPKSKSSKCTSEVVAMIGFQDIIGVIPCAKKNVKKDQDFYFEIHSYSVAVSECGSGCGCFGGSGGSAGGRERVSERVRKKRVDVIQCEDLVSYWNWQHAINRVIRGLDVVVSECVSEGVSGDRQGVIEAPPIRRVLVVVNPVGGTGIALKIWKRDTEPMLLAANIEYTLLITERANHAKEYMTREDLTIFNRILIIGGDGLIFEVVSGIMARDDQEQVFKNIPLAPIPGGSGNGLAMSILFECGEVCTPSVATYVAITGIPAFLDISKATTTSESYFSFLSLSWGMVADVDLNSESMRWMGEARFTVSGINRVIEKKLYRGRLSMLLADSHTGGSITTPISDRAGMTYDEESQVQQDVILPPVTEPLEVGGDPRWLVLEDDFAMVWVMQTSHASTSMYTGPGATLNDGVFTVLVVRNCSRLTLLKIMIEMETGNHVKIPELEVYKAKAYRLEPLTDEGLYSLDGERIEYGPFQCEMHSTSSLQVLKSNNKASQ